MAKASKAKQPARIEEARWTDPPRWSGWLLLVGAASGLLLAAVSTYVHHQVTSSAGGYTSFCNVSTTINCDTVVTSRYGQLLGLPVSVWAIAFYAVLLALAFRASGEAAARARARADAFAVAVAGSLFSAYLAVISLVVLKTLCLLCAGLYLVSVATLVAAWRQASPLAETFVRWRERWNQIRRRPIFATAALGAVAGVFFLSGWLGAQTHLTRDQVFRSNPQFYDWYTNQPIVASTLTGGYSQGPENAPIQLVEFSDFECPHCAQAYVVLKDVLPRYQNQVRFTHHNFPLSSDCNEAVPQKGHEHACQAAVAAECAAEGGRFQPYVNLLFANQGALDEKSLVGYAKQVGLDVGVFEKCLASKAAAEKVADDAKNGEKLGVRSTPTFLINGRKIEGNMTYENWLLAFAVELDKG